MVRKGRIVPKTAATARRPSGKRASVGCGAMASAKRRAAARAPSAACGLWAQATTQARHAVKSRRPRIAANGREVSDSTRFEPQVCGS